MVGLAVLALLLRKEKGLFSYLTALCGFCWVCNALVSNKAKFCEPL